MKSHTRMNRRFGWVGALLALASLSGCAAPVAFADWERGADFSPGKTFAVTESANLPKDLTERQRALLTIINTAIERELVQKGYVKAPAGSAQLVVDFDVITSTRQRVTVQERACYAGYHAELPPATTWDTAAIACEESLVSQYEEGTLIIDVYDAGLKELVWHGWTSREALPADSPELPGIVEQATVDILSRFPPG